MSYNSYYPSQASNESSPFRQLADKLDGNHYNDYAYTYSNISPSSYNSSYNAYSQSSTVNMICPCPVAPGASGYFTQY